MRRSQQKEEITAWMGEEMRVEGGSIRFEGCLRVDGQLTGGSVAGDTLIVGERARISGKLSVQVLTVYGRVEGRVEVVREVHLLPGAVFSGEMILHAPTLVVDPGATFHGRVRMVAEAS